MFFRGYSFDLHPTPAQSEALSQWVGVCRLVYNLGLEQRRDFWRQAQRAGKPITLASQSRELTVLRREFDWIAAVPSDVAARALQDLDRAYSRYFKGLGAAPVPRKKGAQDSVRVRQDLAVRRLNAKWAEVRLTKLGWVRFRVTRHMPGDLREVTISHRAGRWGIAFTRQIEQAASDAAGSDGAVGIDRGVANTLSLSTGEHYSVPSRLAVIERKRRRARRVLARRTRGSRRYGKQRVRVAALSAKAARVRRDWQHRISTDIVRRFGTVAVEDLQIANMTARGAGKRGLNRSILNQGWGAFERLLAYKLAERGGTLVKVPAPYTSQTCQACGVIDRRSRESQSVFACVHCGHRDHADTNAALEILRRSTALMPVEDAHQRSPEAGTDRLAA